MNCPICKGPMWDNRNSKRNPKAPDYKCKDKECDGAVWIDSKKPETNGSGNGNGAPANKTGNGNHSCGQTPSGREPVSSYLAKAAKLLKACHQMAEKALGDQCTPEDARSLFIAMHREGYVLDVSVGKPATKPAPVPEPDELEETLSEAAETEDSGLDL